MARSNKFTGTRPRSGIKAEERRIEHQSRRAELKKQLALDPEQIPLTERFWEEGDIWNWD